MRFFALVFLIGAALGWASDTMADDIGVRLSWPPNPENENVERYRVNVWAEHSFRIQNARFGGCLTYDRDQTVNAAECGGVNQLYRLGVVGDRYALVDRGGWCLKVPATTDNDTPITRGPCEASDNFAISALDSDLRRIDTHQGVTFDEHAQRHTLVQWRWFDNDNQRWRFVPSPVDDYRQVALIRADDENRIGDGAENVPDGHYFTDLPLTMIRAGERYCYNIVAETGNETSEPSAPECFVYDPADVPGFVTPPEVTPVSLSKPGPLSSRLFAR